jgi:hypothetical protein
MSSEIAKLYDEVMSGQAETTEKTAADVNADSGPEFDAAFFEKVAAGDEEAVGIVNQFIEEARAEGHSEEEIENALGEAMVAAGIEDEQAIGEPETDEFEEAKMSAYLEGSEQAISDVLESPLAKEAGITIDDLVEYELGGHYGTGYAETRTEAEEAITKIAETKAGLGAKAKELGSKLLGKIKAGGAAYGRAMRGSGAGGLKGALGAGAGKARAAQVWGARLGTGAVAGGAGYGAYRMAKGKKDKK